MALLQTFGKVEKLEARIDIADRNDVRFEGKIDSLDAKVTSLMIALGIQAGRNGVPTQTLQKPELMEDHK